MNLPIRQKLRLSEYDYGQNGAYFITVCTKDRVPCLSDVKIVGDDAYIVPQIKLKQIGKIVDKYIKNIPEIDKYVIMPDHIHFILRLSDGTMWASSPTKNASNIVRSLKTMVTKEIGYSVFQRSFYDHVIRNEEDYVEIWDYIENNPMKLLLEK